MTTLVATLADDDAEARRRWQLRMTSLVEAIVADAIEASALEFPEDHAFWGAFSRAQCRDIGHALVVARLPVRRARRLDRRTLSLAARPVAGARLRGARPDAVRHWPTADETPACSAT